MYSCCPPNRFASTCLQANLKRKNLQVEGRSICACLAWYECLIRESLRIREEYRHESEQVFCFFWGGYVILFVWPAFQKYPAHIILGVTLPSSSTRCYISGRDQHGHAEAIWAKDHLPEWLGCREAKACAQWRWWWPPHFTQSQRNFTGGGSQPYELPYVAGIHIRLPALLG